MEWVLIWLVPTFIALLGGFIFSVWWPFWSLLIGWGILVAIIRWAMYEDEYERWSNNGCQGDHPWFEWTHCKNCYANVMAQYDPKTYCKIDMETFEKYFAVNPSRYKFNYSCVEFDNEDSKVELLMVFPRKELRKFFIFRRDYLQSRQMVNVINFVQSDIDKMREDAQSYINKAKEMMNHDFGSELNGTEGKNS